MGFADNIKASLDKIQTQSKELHVAVEVKSGKQFLNMGPLTSSITIRQNADGNIYFDKVDGFFEITDYQWEGPRYKTVATSNTTEKSKEKTKKKGGLGGAVIGTMVAGPIGTAVGFAATRKKDKKGEKEANTIASEEEVETKSNAKMTLRNLSTGESFTIGFLCDSKIDGDLSNFNMHTQRTITTSEASQQKSKVELMKEYKDLLDAGIINEEEFAQKKKEILGI